MKGALGDDCEGWPDRNGASRTAQEWAVDGDGSQGGERMGSARGGKTAVAARRRHRGVPLP
eukprot:6343776-Pyramimonas_sp.AAC.1